MKNDCCIYGVTFVMTGFIVMGQTVIGTITLTGDTLYAARGVLLLSSEAV